MSRRHPRSNGSERPDQDVLPLDLGESARRADDRSVGRDAERRSEGGGVAGVAEPGQVDAVVDRADLPSGSHPGGDRLVGHVAGQTVEPRDVERSEVSEPRL